MLRIQAQAGSRASGQWAWLARAVATVIGWGGAEGGAAEELRHSEVAMVRVCGGRGNTLGASRGSRGALHAESFCRLVLERRSRSGAVR